jgi:hypothetical protein
MDYFFDEIAAHPAAVTDCAGDLQGRPGEQELRIDEIGGVGPWAS